MDYNNRNRGDFLLSFYSSVEGAMKLNLRHSVPFEMLFPMVSLLVEFSSIRFWPKTIDYSKAFLEMLFPHLTSHELDVSMLCS